MKKLLLLAAAAPLFQLSQCHTGIRQSSLIVVNGAPQAAFYSFLSALFPGAVFDQNSPNN